MHIVKFNSHNCLLLIFIQERKHVGVVITQFFMITDVINNVIGKADVRKT